MERCYRFALIRVVPDPGRGEVLNVGICTRDANGVSLVHMLPSLRKVEAVNAAFETDALVSIPKLIERWQETVWRHSTKPAVLGPVVVEEVGEFIAKNEAEYGAHVAHLMHRLVDPVKRERRQGDAGRAGVKAELTRAFKLGEQLGKDPEDLRKGLIVPRFPISESLELYADFAVKNGTLSLINTIDLRVSRSKLRQKHDEACAIALSFDTAQRVFQENKHRVVVYADDPELGADVTPHLGLLRMNADRVLNLRTEEETMAFVKEIRAAARHTSY